MILSVVIGLAISYVLLFALSILLKDNSIADIFWGLGFLQVMIHSFILSGTAYLSQIMILALIVLWSLRIAGYILSKKIRHNTEDRRYQEYRKEWKYFYLRSFFQIYLLQGFLMLIIAIPLFLVNMQPIAEIGVLFIIGILISLFGLIFESISDMQLRNFLKNKKNNTIMTQGLWKYSRHPNYFGESVFWFGIGLATVQLSLFAIISFITITFLLRFVSGVPMAEKRYVDNKEYIEYKKKTPPMFPNFFIK